MTDLNTTTGLSRASVAHRLADFDDMNAYRTRITAVVLARRAALAALQALQNLVGLLTPGL